MPPFMYFNANEGVVNCKRQVSSKKDGLFSVSFCVALDVEGEDPCLFSISISQIETLSCTSNYKSVHAYKRFSFFHTWTHHCFSNELQLQTRMSGIATLSPTLFFNFQMNMRYNSFGPNYYSSGLNIS